ncbi:TonB-dependent receptor plug domain-containing protein [Acinetobacter zhairhuonensis]|uniref:TonB-dependent receptor plug domain-containing protein n=1 Tax=Acinetobacter sp. A7.4 TaxID=2919921 RepID=UPI001F4DE79D|nr:TonB-dependent receptor [Acinetobacter sp. A7.4]MCJ8160443.1 TonB-dependent receptor [Acinetobacter sp. A7.4]
MDALQPCWKFSALTCALLGISITGWAADTTQATVTDEPVQTLKTLKLQADSPTNKNNDISAIAKTIINREEMLKYGDQTVSDALRRAAGFQMPSGSGPRGPGGASGMRFRGSGAPIFMINGEPIQGGPRGGMSIIDTLTPYMIERIEITKQPSVTQASVAVSAVINIILKEPLQSTRLSGTARMGYGLYNSGASENERKNLTLQMDGRDSPWLYSVSANQSWDDTTSITETQTSSQTRVQKNVSERKSSMISPRVEYEIDDEKKVVAELFYRNHERDGTRSDQVQQDKNDSLRLNTRFERQVDKNSDKVRFSYEKQDETELTRSSQASLYIDQQIEEYGLAYDGIRQFDADRQIKFGLDTRSNTLESNTADTLDEQRYALYSEGSWRFTDQQTLTLGLRQEWIHRSGLVDYDDQHLSPVLAHRYNFDDQWSLQTNISQAFRSPKANNLLPTVSISTDSDAGSLNNPDRGGNPFLRPEKIQAYESTLGYNTAAGGVNLTGFYRQIDDYIESVIRQENGRYVQRPQNQPHATTYGIELSGHYALKQDEQGHSWMLNSQLSTIRAKVEDDTQRERLVSDVAPYTASMGLSYNFQPWRLSTSINLSYTPEFTRALENQPYNRTSNERVNLDISATKRFKQGWSTSLSARNLLSTDYKERLNNQSDDSLYQARISQAIPSLLLNIEKKF